MPKPKSQYVELQELPQIRGYYFLGFDPYQFDVFRDKLVIYGYNNQRTVINLTHDQLLDFLRNVINKRNHLEIEDGVEYVGTWLSGTLDEAVAKYNAMIAANNAEVRAAAADYGGKHRGHSHKRSGHKRSGKSGHKRSGHKRSGHKKRSGKSRRH